MTVLIVFLRHRGQRSPAYCEIPREARPRGVPSMPCCPPGHSRQRGRSTFEADSPRVAERGAPIGRGRR